MIIACAPQTETKEKVLSESGVWKQTAENSVSYLKVTGNQFEMFGSADVEAGTVVYAKQSWPDDFLGVSVASCRREATELSVTYSWTFVPVTFETEDGMDYESSGEVVLTEASVSKKVSYRGRKAGTSEWTEYASVELVYKASNANELDSFVEGKTVQEIEEWPADGSVVDTTLEESTPTVISTDNYFDSEGSVKVYINAIYASLYTFMSQKNALESKILAGDFNDLNPSSSVIRDLWASGYKVLAILNSAISNPAFENFYNYYRHAKGIRAFLAYQMTGLWGDTLFPLAVLDSSNPYSPQISQSEILRIALNDLSESAPYPDESGGRQYYLNDWSLTLLEAEISLSTDSVFADDYFESSSSFDSEFSLFSQDGNILPIYSNAYYNLLKAESKGNSDIVSAWESANQVYGHWFALKRIGKAQEITNCQSFQLLLPIPNSEIGGPYNVTQNPGY